MISVLRASSFLFVVVFFFFKLLLGFFGVEFKVKTALFVELEISPNTTRLLGARICRTERSKLVARPMLEKLGWVGREKERERE
ncbi:hypothetical protein L3X38_026150 [Prunus dulcis]|uniref:Uncharacterized protein n=1 Tax=Prunus dulcis TaxID=3755 RepID=A0AAD4W5M5_PRUDU|nr:hypothetical protein L3X38_026150 [Prunus dulcis]